MWSLRSYLDFAKKKFIYRIYLVLYNSGVELIVLLMTSIAS